MMVMFVGIATLDIQVTLRVLNRLFLVKRSVTLVSLIELYLMENVLDTLSPRERDVLRLRYGLDDGRMKTLEEIGQIFNVTRERIRQIEAKALRKLRHPNRNSILKEYIR